MAREGREGIATRLYRGELSWDFIGHRRYWYALSSAVMLIGILSLALRGLNPSIDFKGGAQFQGPINHHTISDVRNAVSSTGIDPQVAQTTGSGSATRFQVQTETLTQVQVEKVETALEAQIGTNPTDPGFRSDLDITTVGSTWGAQITHKAILGLVIFLLAVIGYLSIRFEWKMALAAIIALIHDLIITAGIYSLSGLEVSPSTVIALLTILGYSLYDTVVVFDKVRENTAGIAGGSKMTFSQAANLAVNQTLVRSINTSIIALLPVLGLIVIGAGLLGAGSLDDLSVALFIGLASGAYSSIFIATPLLCDFKERETTYQQLAKRVASRQVKEARESSLQPATAGAPLAAGAGSFSATVTDPGGAATGHAATGPGSSSASPARSEAVDSPDADLPRREGVPPPPGSRSTQRPRRKSKGGRPGGRGSRSRKRR